MRLQTKHAHRKLTTINVNGTIYQIDDQCCVDVENEADAKKLLSLGDEWSSRISSPSASKVNRIPEPGKPLRSAVEFVELLSSDDELAQKVGTLRSFASLAALAGGLGFRFTEAEFKDATTAYEAAAKKTREMEAARKKKKATAEKKPAKKTRRKKAVVDEES